MSTSVLVVTVAVRPAAVCNSVVIVVAVNTISAGQLLCGGLFSVDPLSTWFAAVALLHAVNGNTAQKEQLLRVQLATSLGNPPVSLLQQCANILAQVRCIN